MLLLTVASLYGIQLKLGECRALKAVVSTEQLLIDTVCDSKNRLIFKDDNSDPNWHKAQD